MRTGTRTCSLNCTGANSSSITRRANGMNFPGTFGARTPFDQATEALTAVIDLYGTEAGRQQWERLKMEKAGQTDRAKKHAATEDTLFKRIRALQTKARKENVLFLARTFYNDISLVRKGKKADYLIQPRYKGKRVFFHVDDLKKFADSLSLTPEVVYKHKPKNR